MSTVGKPPEVSSAAMKNRPVTASTTSTTPGDVIYSREAHTSHAGSCLPGSPSAGHGPRGGSLTEPFSFQHHATGVLNTKHLVEFQLLRGRVQAGCVLAGVMCCEPKGCVARTREAPLPAHWAELSSVVASRRHWWQAPAFIGELTTFWMSSALQSSATSLTWPGLPRRLCGLRTCSAPGCPWI